MQALASRAPHAVACGIGVLIVAQVVGFARSLSSVHAPNGLRPAPRVALPHRTDMSLFAGANLFGEPPRAPETDPAKAVASKGDFSLKGTVAMGSTGEGFAIIAPQGGPSHLYRIGNPISANVVLRQVSPDYVLLLNDGRLERLALPRGPLATQLVAHAMGRTESATLEAAGTLTADTRASLQTFGLDVIADSAGGITGVSGQGSPSWHHSGLEPTDVIVAIDGTPVGEVLKTPGALDNASIAAATTLTVLRAGVQMDITAVAEDTSAQAPIHSRRRT